MIVKVKLRKCKARLDNALRQCEVLITYKNVCVCVFLCAFVCCPGIDACRPITQLWTGAEFFLNCHISPQHHLRSVLGCEHVRPCPETHTQILIRFFHH